MLDIEILAIGKIKADYNKSSVGEYIKRIKPYVRLRISELEPVSFNKSNKDKAKAEEGKRLSQYLKKFDNSYIIFLEERGKNYDSIELADFLEKKKQKLIFVIGGSLGIDKSISIKPDAVVSLSKLTFNHELARVILLEQLYRAATIINKKDYHY